MNESIAVFFCQLVCLCAGLIVDITVQYYLCAVTSGTVYLDQRCGGGHYDSCLAAVAFCRISHALGMVACGGGDQTLGTLFIGQSAHLVISTSQLVSSGEL